MSLHHNRRMSRSMHSNNWSADCERRVGYQGLRDVIYWYVQYSLCISFVTVTERPGYSVWRVKVINGSPLTNEIWNTHSNTSQSPPSHGETWYQGVLHIKAYPSISPKKYSNHDSWLNITTGYSTDNGLDMSTIYGEDHTTTYSSLISG